MRKFLYALLLASISLPGFSATIFTGQFASEVLLLVDPEGQILPEGPPSSLLGSPDAEHVDLDGGGVTLSFGENITAFDYQADIPEGTEVVIVELVVKGSASDIDVPNTVRFGYGAIDDANGDGEADGANFPLTLLDSLLVSELMLSDTYDPYVFFYSISNNVDFSGFTPNFYLAITAGDFELDSVQILSASPIPVPSAIALLLVPLLTLAKPRRSSGYLTLC